MMENLPPGFRFHPTDEELITYYLTKKVSDFNFTSRAIVDVDLNKCEPWDLPGKASMGEKVWYFFSMRDRKYPTGLRTNRATEGGYWKTTGKDKEIFRDDVNLVGMKKTLVFYKGRAPKGEKSNWIMHEYRLQPKFSFQPSKEEWVVCRVFQKSSTVKKPHQTPYSPQSSESQYDNITNNNNPNYKLGDTELLQNLNNFVNLPLNVPNWNAVREASDTLPSLISWPINLGIMNPFLLRGLQHRLYQPREASTYTSVADYTPMISSPGILPLGSELMNSNMATTEASSSRVFDDSVQNQQQEEQPFNIW